MIDYYKIKEIKKLIFNNKNIVFLTGAGISVPSGIPDYRSGKGLYSEKPETILSYSYFSEEPNEFYKFMKESMDFRKYKPNVIHKAISDLQQAKSTISHITQNIDGLSNQLPGEVIQFHGNLSNFYCTSCGKNIDCNDYYDNTNECDCGGYCRPDILLYDETIDLYVFSKAISKMSEADVVIIIGTSMQVAPFNQLIYYTNPNTKIVTINKSKLDNIESDIEIIEDASTILPLIVY